MSIIRGIRGSISVFLILVLMPMYTCAYLAIDSARYAAAESRISGALDLTGNAALAKYDRTLKELYGISAMNGTSQSVQDITNAFFTGMIDGETGYQNAVVMNTQKLSAQYGSTQNLLNSDVMGKQICSYMKYRAPYEWSNDFFEKTSTFIGLEKVPEVINKAIKHSEASEELGNPLKNIYFALKSNDMEQAKGYLDKLLAKVEEIQHGTDDTRDESNLCDDEIKTLLSNIDLSVINDERITKDSIEELKTAIEKDVIDKTDTYKTTSLYGYIDSINSKASPSEYKYINLLDELKEVTDQGKSMLEMGNDTDVVSKMLRNAEFSAQVEQKWGKEYGFSNVIPDVSLLVPKGGVKDLYKYSFFTEYIINMFSCNATQPCDVNLSDIPFFNGPMYGKEAEYIIFGHDNVDENVAIARGYIFASRMLVNALYAFTNNEMRREALFIATSIAAYTGVGVVAVQNLLLLAWTMAESMVDLSQLCNGKTVAFYKNKSTWTLGVDNISSVLVSGIESCVTNGIDDVFSAIENLSEEKLDEITGLAGSYIENICQTAAENLASVVMTPVEAGLKKMFSNVDITSYSANDIKTFVLNIIDKNDDGSNGYKLAKSLFVNYFLDDLCIQISEQMNLFTVESFNNITSNIYQEFLSCLLEELRKLEGEMNDEIQSCLARQQGSIKQSAKDVIDKYADKIDDLLGVDKASGNSSIAVKSGIGISYTDYLKLFALANLCNANGQSSVLKRCAIVMQINCAKRKPNFDISNCFVEVEIESRVRVGLHMICKRERFAY